MRSFKTFINEARNPLRKQDPYIQAKAVRYKTLRQPSTVDVDMYQDDKEREMRNLERIENRIKNFQRNKALKVELSSLEELNAKKQQLQQKINQLDFLVTQTTNQPELPSFRLRKYPSGKKREPYKPVYNKYGVKWFIYPEHAEKYKTFEAKLPTIMSIFFNELKRRRLTKIPKVNFVATPSDKSKGSGQYLSHSIQIDPSKLDLSKNSNIQELLYIMIHEYGHHIFKMLPYNLKKPGGIFNQLYLKQLDAFREQAPAKYKQFASSILALDDKFSSELKREIGKFTKHPSYKGYAFTDPEELFAETLVYFTAQPEFFKVIINIINRYI